MRRIRPYWLMAIMILALIQAAPALAQRGKTYSADQFNVDLVVQPDGSAQVTERVTFRFEGGPFTFAFRTLPTRYTDGITNLDLREDERPYTLGGTAPGQYTLTQTRDGLDVRWTFEPTSDATRTFTLSYLVKGVMRAEQGQAALRWGALPPNHEYPISESLVTVEFPSGTVIERAQILKGDGLLQSVENRVFAQAVGVGRNDELVVGAWTPLDAFTGVPPQWQVEQEARDVSLRRQLSYGVMIAMLIFGIGLPALFLWRSRVPAHPPVSRDEPVTAPPEGLRPAQVAALTDHEAGASLGTLLDLARRGVVEIRELPAQGRWGKPQFEFVLLQPNAALEPFERSILDAAFARADQPYRVAMKDLARGLQKARGSINQTLVADLTERGLLDPARMQTKRRFYVAAAVLFVVGVVVGALALLVGPIAIPPLLAFWALALVAFWLGASLSRRSAAGAVMAAGWSTFEKYLKQAMAGKAAITPDRLEPYLPYAAAFGLERKWIRRFAPAGVGIPAWFHAVSATPDASFAIFAAAISSASSSAGASAGAAGAGAAGGGASGAG